MTLGKRYIALWKFKSAVRPDGGCEDIEDALYDSERAAEHSRAYHAAGASQSNIIEIDLDDSKRRDESDEAAYERNERVMLAAAAEVERLKPIVSVKLGCEPPKSRDDERRQMRAVIDVMRPIVDQALSYTRESDPLIGKRHIHLVTAVAANRERLGLAMSAWGNSQTISDDSQHIGNLLSVDEWGALNSLLTAIAVDEPRSVALNDRVATLVASAISKLFAANAGRVS